MLEDRAPDDSGEGAEVVPSPLLPSLKELFAKRNQSMLDVESWLEELGLTLEQLQAADRGSAIVKVRHQIITHLLFNGWSRLEVAKFVGRDISTVKYYQDYKGKNRPYGLNQPGSGLKQDKSVSEGTDAPTEAILQGNHC